MNFMLVFQNVEFPAYLKSDTEVDARNEAYELVHKFPEKGVAMLISGCSEEGFYTVCTYLPKTHYEVEFPINKS